MVCSGNIGEPSILAEDACIHDGILAVTELGGQVSAEYLYYAFRTLKREFLRLTTNGGIWSNLTTDVLKSIVVPVPPIECLQETVDRITQFTSTIEAVKQREADYKQLTQSLVNSLLDRGDHR